MKNVVVVTAALWILTSCTSDPSGAATASLSDDATLRSTSAEAFVAMGGHRVEGPEFKSEIVDKTLGHPDWTWNINSDGSTHSAARDGSWRTTQGKWRFENNKFCRTSPEDWPGERCSAVYELGGVYKWTLHTSETELNEWYALVE